MPTPQNPTNTTSPQAPPPREQAVDARRKAKAEAEAARAEAKKYPMEDIALLAELTSRARAEGAPPPPDVPALESRFSAEEGERLLSALYVADTLGQFVKHAVAAEGPLAARLGVEAACEGAAELLPGQWTLQTVDEMLGGGVLMGSLRFRMCHWSVCILEDASGLCMYVHTYIHAYQCQCLYLSEDAIYKQHRPSSLLHIMLLSGHPFPNPVHRPTGHTTHTAPPPSTVPT